MSIKVLKIFTDGGSRGNPGDAAIGVFAQMDEKKFFSHADYIGETTNNVAEYKALIKSIEILLPYLNKPGIDEIIWHLDSKLVVEQINKNWKIKQDHLVVLANQAWEMLNKLKISFKIIYVPREQNTQADALVNQALDAKILFMKKREK